MVTASLITRAGMGLLPDLSVNGAAEGLLMRVSALAKCVLCEADVASVLRMSTNDDEQDLCANWARSRRRDRSPYLLFGHATQMAEALLEAARELRTRPDLAQGGWHRPGALLPRGPAAAVRLTGTRSDHAGQRAHGQLVLDGCVVEDELDLPDSRAAQRRDRIAPDDPFVGGGASSGVGYGSRCDGPSSGPRISTWCGTAASTSVGASPCSVTAESRGRPRTNRPLRPHAIHS